MTHLRETTTRLESAYHAAITLNIGRPFPHRDPITRADVEGKLAHAGKDPAIADLVFGRRPPPGLVDSLAPAQEWCAELWTDALGRDALLNHALAVGQFNTAPTSGRAAAPPVDARVLVSAALEELAAVAKYGGWDVAQYADTVIRTASDQLEAAVRHAARVRTPRTQDAAHEAVRAADTVRDLLWLIAAVKTLAWHFMWPAAGQAASLQANLVAAKRTLAKDTARPVELADLVSRTRSSTAVVSVVGAITGVTITHETRGKAVTRFVVADLDSGDEITATVDGFKADAGGAVAGSAVRLVGTWKRDTAPGALRVSREAISRDSSASLEQYLRWFASDVYLPRPHGLLVFPSWVRGSTAPMNAIRFGVTARKG